MQLRIGKSCPPDAPKSGLLKEDGWGSEIRKQEKKLVLLYKTTGQVGGLKPRPQMTNGPPQLRKTLQPHKIIGQVGTQSQKTLLL